MKNKEQKQVFKKRIPTESLTQYDVLKKHHKFLREDSDQQIQIEKKKDLSKEELYGQRMAKKYYEKLFKQYGIVDLSRYTKGQIGCRWRSQKEVINGKGEKICGEVNCKNESTNKFEMNFGYVQDQIKKNALIKVSVCKECGIKLNYKNKLKQVE